MKRTLTYMISAVLLMLAVTPASAQSDSANASTPHASATAQASPVATAQASPAATPQASPVAGELEAGEWEYTDDEGNTLTIDLTALGADINGEQIVEGFKPEEGTVGTDFTFAQELDAANDCRIFEFDTPDVPYFVALCSNDEFGLWTFGSDLDAVTHVAEQFVDGSQDLVPEGYTEEN